MIAVEADLNGEFDHLRYSVHAAGRELVVRLEGNPATLIASLTRLRPALPALRTAAQAFVRLGLHVIVRAGDTQIAELGAGVEANTVARLLQVPNARFGFS